MAVATLTTSVLAGGRVFPAGTAREGEAAEVIPAGRWWSDHDADQADAEYVSAEPPRSGRGSGVEAWREYAAQLGLEHDEDATRDDIVALVDAQQD